MNKLKANKFDMWKPEIRSIVFLSLETRGVYAISIIRN